MIDVSCKKCLIYHNNFLCTDLCYLLQNHVQISWGSIFTWFQAQKIIQADRQTNFKLLHDNETNNGIQMKIKCFKKYFSLSNQKIGVFVQKIWNKRITCTKIRRKYLRKNLEPFVKKWLESSNHSLVSQYQISKV